MTRRLVLLLLALAAALPAAADPDLSADALLRDHLWRAVRAAPEGRRPKVGLVLSAGSLRGVAHVGVIKVLENAGFPIDVVAGTSMGAVIGGLYSGGLSLDRLWSIASGMSLGRHSTRRLWRLWLRTLCLLHCLLRGLGNRYFALVVSHANHLA